MKKRVLFVCLGNICRSPAAEGVFREMVLNAGLTDQIEVDSAGTGGWHVGEPPDPRMVELAQKRGYDLRDLEARQFNAPDDFKQFDYILTMDPDNLRTVLSLDVSKQFHAKVRPLASFCLIHSVPEIPDPYYHDESGFDYVMDLVEDSCAQLLVHLRKELK